MYPDPGPLASEQIIRFNLFRFLSGKKCSSICPEKATGNFIQMVNALGLSLIYFEFCIKDEETHIMHMCALPFFFRRQNLMINRVESHLKFTQMSTPLTDLCKIISIWKDTVYELHLQASSFASIQLLLSWAMHSVVYPIVLCKCINHSCETLQEL